MGAASPSRPRARSRPRLRVSSTARQPRRTTRRPAAELQPYSDARQHKPNSPRFQLTLDQEQARTTIENFYGHLPLMEGLMSSLSK